MKQSLKFIGLVAILPLVMAALSPDLIGQADAEIAQGSQGTISPKSYGSATKDIVCGDRLCSASEGNPYPGNIGRAQ